MSIYYLVICVFGLCIGSFLNVLIDRLPKSEQVLKGRSRCDFCKKTLRWFELIPLLSFIIQHGRCRRCHKKLSIQYPFVEVTAGIGFVILYFSSPNNLTVLLSYCLLFTSLLVIFVTDLKYQIIPDSMVVLGVLGILLQGDSLRFPQGVTLWISALISSILFFLLWLITKGKGMGFGDVKLAFLLGLFLGFPGIVIALYAAFLTGALSGVILILQGKKTVKSKIPFGPFLIAGTLIALIWGDRILGFWKGYV